MGEGQLLTEEFFSEEDQEIRKVVLEIAGIEEGQKVKAYTLRVVEFTISSKAQAADYEPLGVIARFAPNDLDVHVIVHKPEGLVDSAGDVGLLGQLIRTVGGEVDRMTVELAHRHADNWALAKEWAKPRRVETEKEVIRPKEIGEVL